MLTKDNVDDVAEWVGGQEVTEINALSDKVTYAGVNVPTVNGVQRASETDFVFKNSRGEVSVERYGTFLREYEES